MDQELMVIVASAMSKEQIINRIEEAISDYHEALVIGNDKEIKQKIDFLGLSCNLFILNVMTDGSTEGAVKTIQKMKTMASRDKLFETDKN